ncbi:exodeoxyribonuclease VII large subunit [Kribbella solani]|uniref:Exodeoxyribonuclease 7 large subunit n=1 Tax=Kribbella solani TaxID=236067 RepID=A0A841DY00_9ACTN|nr:exodeoxyribonuclease VII large subunit [Kribbella solani]MBB5983463.1 exodeoxyribonuclease VII large subunit [Kribbella solani]MDX2971902.1 exodeoxyribonuclease VII large subunit [Kribbella solani]MDX3006961.1 exodeoxyribonuclease VII large subunit [Kribbella solani]
MALETSPDAPAAVRTIANGIASWINQLGAVWVEGQLTDVSIGRGTTTVFGTLRDTDADISLRFTCNRRVFEAVDPPVTDGSRVVVNAKPNFFARRGTLALAVNEIRHVGIGELLARIERLKQLLAAEGLFAAYRKQKLPFLPHTIGLICGRDSAAERDVLENAKRRWPAVAFRIEYASVQGPSAAGEVMTALRKLDADEAVEVIVIARGGGSLEDLLPFSDEGLIRAVSKTGTPVVSAIGHEPDSPLLDLVADLRASTPTDAAKRIVPDVREELDGVRLLRERGLRAITSWLDRETHALAAVRSRPALAAPVTDLQRRGDEITALVERNRRTLTHRLDRASDDITHRLASVRALSPKATLERGYSVLQLADGTAVREMAQVAPGDLLQARVTDGRFAVEVKSEETK